MVIKILLVLLLIQIWKMGEISLILNFLVINFIKILMHEILLEFLVEFLLILVFKIILTSIFKLLINFDITYGLFALL